MPEAYIPEVAARVMSLSEPDKKMSKSSPNENSYILVMDKPEVILRKFKRAVTDSEGASTARRTSPGSPTSSRSMRPSPAPRRRLWRANLPARATATLNPPWGEAVIETLRPIREETERLLADKGYLESLYRQGGREGGRHRQPDPAEGAQEGGLRPR